jgi:hypothetical protein
MTNDDDGTMSGLSDKQAVSQLAALGVSNYRAKSAVVEARQAGSVTLGNHLLILEDAGFRIETQEMSAERAELIRKLTTPAPARKAAGEDGLTAVDDLLHPDNPAPEMSPEQRNETARVAGRAPVHEPPAWQSMQPQSIIHDFTRSSATADDDQLPHGISAEQDQAWRDMVALGEEIQGGMTPEEAAHATGLDPAVQPGGPDPEPAGALIYGDGLDPDVRAAAMGPWDPELDEESRAAEARDAAMGELRRRFQEFIDANAGQDPPPGEHFTIDGAAFYRVTQGQWRELMAMAPRDIAALNDEHPPPWPAGESAQPLPGGYMSRDEMISTLTRLGYAALVAQEAVQPDDEPHVLRGHIVEYGGDIGGGEGGWAIRTRQGTEPVPPEPYGPDVHLSQDGALTVLAHLGYAPELRTRAVYQAASQPGRRYLLGDHGVRYDSQAGWEITDRIDREWTSGMHEAHCGPRSERDDRCGPNGEMCGCPCHRGEPVPPLAAGLSGDQAVATLITLGYNEEQANHYVADAIAHGFSGLPRDHAVWYTVTGTDPAGAPGSFAIYTKVPIPGHPGHFQAGVVPHELRQQLPVTWHWDVQAERRAEAQAERERARTWLEAPYAPGLEFLAGILDALEAVDAHLDEAGPQWAKDCPEANMYRRIGKAQSEATEAMDELSLLTGENPRKGQDPEARDRMLDELGDTAMAALLGIQSQTKNVNATWRIFLRAVVKARSRVPQPEPGGHDDDTPYTGPFQGREG